MDTHVQSGGGFLQEIRIGPFRLRSDEPVEQGGTGQGPTPYALLCAALGACTSMTLRLYARSKGWPLDEVLVVVRHNKIYAMDCAECETREGRLDQIEREITLIGKLDDAQRKRLMEIADKCPVHRTLTSEVRIVTRLV
jgi:putative redox protein